MVAFAWSPIAACFLLLQATALVSSQAVTVTVSAQSTDYSVLRSIESELVSLEAATITSVASAAASTTSSSAAQTYTVSVGIDHKFRPDVVQANAGDIIEFNFFPPNHSVVRAEYMFPCIPYENTGRGKVGFFSGFRPVDAFLNDPPTWNLRINNTDPIFYYCSAPGSCNNYAMIGVINPNKSVSLETQKSLALQAAYVMNPGDPFPPEASSSIASLTTSPTSTSTLPSSTAATASTTPTPAPAEEKEDDLSTGAIVGIALGGAAILLLAAALFYYFFSRSRTLKQPLASPPLSSATRHGPDMYQSGGTVFVPVLPKDYRSSALSQQPYDVPPYSEEPLRSASPRSDVGDVRSYTGTPAPSLSPRSPYSPHSPQEMYAPFPHPKPAQQTV